MAVPEKLYRLYRSVVMAVQGLPRRGSKQDAGLGLSSPMGPTITTGGGLSQETAASVLTGPTSLVQTMLVSPSPSRFPSVTCLQARHLSRSPVALVSEVWLSSPHRFGNLLHTL